MALKLAVVVVLLSLAGQGLAWPRNDIPESSESEVDTIFDLAETALTPILDSAAAKLGFTDGVKNCFDTTRKIFGHWRRQVSLFFAAKGKRFSLFVGLFKCAWKRQVEEVFQCGTGVLNKYNNEAGKIQRDRETNKQELKDLYKNLPRCLKEKNSVA